MAFRAVRTIAGDVESTLGQISLLPKRWCCFLASLFHFFSWHRLLDLVGVFLLAALAIVAAAVPTKRTSPCFRQGEHGPLVHGGPRWRKVHGAVVEPIAGQV